MLSGVPFKVQGIIGYRFTGDHSTFFENFQTEPKNRPIINGLATALPPPHYPETAKKNCVGGLVEVKVMIDNEGTIISTIAVKGNPVLFQAAENAAAKADFRYRLHTFFPLRVGFLVYNFDSIAKKFCAQN